MPLVVIQTSVPGGDSRPFRITEVLGRVAETAEEALEAAAHQDRKSTRLNSSHRT